MIVGETVTVRAYRETGRDGLNNPVKTWADEATVPGVLVAPASTADLTGDTRPDGDTVVMTLHFPKTYTAPLRGRRVIVRGVEYAVQGDPQAYTDANTPTSWDRPVDVGHAEG